ncbi:MAG TPA: APC family permease [Terriglobales bacterium]|jgi:amino acid transporter|nr:APC family permease [Terriglobales bacterium]
MSLSDLIFGKPLRTSDERAEQIGPITGVPIFGLDALSSAGYGPEAALTLLIPLGALGLHYILPISTAIIILLIIVYFSYMQTIPAYPQGGGSYTVARENLGENAGLLAAAALMIDYILTVAVGISAGVGALISAVPRLQPHTMGLCLGILIFIAIVNLRGMREAGAVFMIPTYMFVGTLGIAILIGIARVIASGGHPVPVVAPHPLLPMTSMVGAWLLLQAFASGCTAMTGVEAVSNGVRAFREPRTKNARITLTIIIGILILLLAGIAYLAKMYQVGATDPGLPGYESVLSQLLGAVAGKGIFYFVSIVSILLVLAFSANTAFADFPRLCQIIALNKYLPSSFASRGRRLVFSHGIYVLAILAGVLLIIFKGITDRLIPLYAIGAFLAFTLSQAGMVMHWRRVGGKGAFHSKLLNGLGAMVTLVTVVVVLVAKFVEGAWITVLLIPILLITMKAVRRHYARIARELKSDTPLELKKLTPPIAIVPITGWNKITEKALCFALELSPEVKAIHVAVVEGDGEDLKKNWKHLVTEPAVQAGYPAPVLEIAPCPYRRVLTTILEIVQKEAKKHPERQIAVVIPELVENRWYNHLLHNKRAAVLKTMLYFLGNSRIVVINVPWYLKTRD